MRLLSIYLILEGIIWALIVAWIFLSLTNIADLNSSKTELVYVFVLACPLLLIVGPVLILLETWPKPGVVLTMLGCLTVTALVLYQVIQGAHREPLQVKPPYVVYGLAIGAVLLGDLVALRLCQIVFTRRR
jgi:hypothetical protein